MSTPPDNFPKPVRLAEVIGDGRPDRAQVARELTTTIGAAVNKIVDDASAIAHASAPQSAASAAEAERRRFLIANIRLARSIRTNVAAQGAISGVKVAGAAVIMWWGWRMWSDWRAQQPPAPPTSPTRPVPDRRTA